MKSCDNTIDERELICTACGSRKLRFNRVDISIDEFGETHRYYYDCEDCQFENLSIVALVQEWKNLESINK